jgi:hypothetical protein
MKKEVFAQLILDFKNQQLPSIIPRELKVDLNIPIKRAITILGPRRSGKTYYLYSLIKDLLKEGIKKENILYINFEEPKLIEISLRDLTSLLEVFYEIYPQNRKDKVWFFFDEIQNIKDWEVFVRGILDKQNAQVFISGSSSKLLSKEIATALRGRALSYLILPFSFHEFLKAKNIQYKKYLSSEEKDMVLSAFYEYFSYGGYPETVIYPEARKKIINEIIEVTIHRDLMERYNLRNIKIVKLMFSYLVKAKEFSIHKFYRFLKSINVKVSKNSLYNYLEFFNDAFIFFPLRKFSYSLKKLEQSIPKIYTVDNAFINEIIGEDKGKKLENLVFLSLLRKGYEPNNELFYFSNKGEVDFLVKQRDKIKELIQVCFNLEDFVTKERQINSLIKVSTYLGCNNLLVITFDYEAEEVINSKKIRFIPIWKWLLQKD